MKISIILAHPNPESFNHAIAKTAEEELSQLGHNVRFHDLCQEQFNPLLPMEELAKNAPLDPLSRHIAMRSWRRTALLLCIRIGGACRRRF